MCYKKDMRALTAYRLFIVTSIFVFFEDVHAVPDDYEATTMTKLKTVLQGLMFGSSDEVEAFVRSLGKEDYDTVLQSIRDDLSMFREANPLQALALESGGAVASSIAAAPFTGGTSIPATATRLALLGAAEGGAWPGERRRREARRKGYERLRLLAEQARFSDYLSQAAGCFDWSTGYSGHAAVGLGGAP